MYADILQPQIPVEIDVIQPQKRKHARKGVRAAEMLVRSFKMDPEHSGGQPPGPFVEVPEHDLVP